MRNALPSALITVGLIAVAMGLTVLDHVADDWSNETVEIALDFLDRLLLIAAAVAGAIMVGRLTQMRLRTDDLEARINHAATEGRDWRRRSRLFLDGLSRSIENQFDEWGLTPAEADVAGLLLKGASLREIATLRRTSEATIRQQAGNVYRKSGLASRTELSAYFLEDLFALGEASLTDGRPQSDRYDA